MSRYTYSRMPPLSRWNTNLTWIKSGTKSLATGVPYEIYSKRYGPDILAPGAQNVSIVSQVSWELRDILEQKRFRPTNTMRASATAVLGREIDTIAKARRAYRSRGRMATVHTKHWQIKSIDSFIVDLHEKLDNLAELPSKPAWLVVIDITIYLEEDDENAIRKPKTARMEIIP